MADRLNWQDRCESNTRLSDLESERTSNYTTSFHNAILVKTVSPREGNGMIPRRDRDSNPGSLRSIVFKTTVINQTLPPLRMAEQTGIEPALPKVGCLSRALRYHYATARKWSQRRESNPQPSHYK